MKYHDWLIEYRKDKKRSDPEFYPLNSEIFEAGRKSRQVELDQLVQEYSLYRNTNFSYEATAKHFDTVANERDKKLKAVKQVLNELKESMTNFKEMDLYDKGVRVVTDCIIRDLEKALRGEHE